MNNFQGREQSYGKTAKGQIAGILEAVITGEHHLEDMYMERLDHLFSLPNFSIESLMSLLGIDPGLRFSASLPRVVAAKLGPLLVEEVEVKGHMDVHASEEDDTHKEAKSGFEGSGKIGYGPVSIGIKVHGSMGISNDRKRSSDYSAGIEWRILAKKQEAPEALMKIIDAMVRMQDKVTDMNMSIVEAEAETLREAAFAGGEGAEGEEADGEDSSENTSEDRPDSSDSRNEADGEEANPSN